MSDTQFETRSVDVFAADGNKSGSVELPGKLFDLPVNIPLIHQVVVAQQAAARQGTHAVKGRGEVSGGGKKPWKQKGTGRARQGSTRAPQWTGGGTVHGPQANRNYTQRTPKKMIAQALLSALSDRARDGKIYVVESFIEGEKPSTKAAMKVLENMGVQGKTLVLLERSEITALLSLRNIPTVHILPVDQINTYDVVNNPSVVFSKAAYNMFLAAKTCCCCDKVETAEEASK